MKAIAWLFDRFCNRTFGASVIDHVLNRFPLWRGVCDTEAEQKPVCHRELNDPNDARLLNAGPILGMFVEWLHEIWFCSCIPAPAHTSYGIMTDKTGKRFKEEFKQRRTADCSRKVSSVPAETLVLLCVWVVPHAHHWGCRSGAHTAPEQVCLCFDGRNAEQTARPLQPSRLHLHKASIWLHK